MKFSLRRLLLAATLLFAIAAACTVNSFAAEAKLGQVTVNSLRFRSKPSLSGAELGKFSSGTKLLIIDTVENGQWYEVVHNFNTGYVSAEYVAILEDADLQLGDGLSKASKVNIRKSPTTSSPAIAQLSKGQRVTVIGVSQGWYKIITGEFSGYVHADLLELVTPVTASRGNEASAEPENSGAEPAVTDSSATPTSIQEEIVAFAKKYLGCKYVYGASGPKTFDCSGFTTFVYKNFGYSINRSSSGQLSNGKAVEKKNLLPGDLVIFRDPSKTKNAASHVGLYIGGNKFIHASSAGGNVVISSLSDSYYARYYIAGRRIL